MIWRTHTVFGLLAGLLLLKHFNTEWFLFLPLVMLGSLLPDIDHENSKINNILPVTKLVPRLFKHRGFFHSVWPAVLAYLGLHIARLDYIGIPLAIGYAAHLFSDCLTRQGCNLLHPVATLNVQGFIMTEGTMEVVVFVLILALDGFLAWKILF